MNSRSVYLILLFLALVCFMGLSESNAQRDKKRPERQQPATPANSPTAPPAATPTPTPTPPEKVLKELQETINGFGQGALSARQERTFNFGFSDACESGCKDCVLSWYFEVSVATVERFKVEAALGAIDPKRISVDGTQVEFETNNGQTITVYTLSPTTRTDSIDAWHLSIRSADGAERVAGLLKRVLNESCPKP